MSKKKGFTLIELLIIVAIISILALVAAIQYSRYRKKAFDTAAVSDLKHVHILSEAYFSDNNQYP